MKLLSLERNLFSTEPNIREKQIGVYNDLLLISGIRKKFLTEYKNSFKTFLKVSSYTSFLRYMVKYRVPGFVDYVSVVEKLPVNSTGVSKCVKVLPKEIPIYRRLLFLISSNDSIYEYKDKQKWTFYFTFVYNDKPYTVKENMIFGYKNSPSYYIDQEGEIYTVYNNKLNTEDLILKSCRSDIPIKLLNIDRDHFEQNYKKFI